MRPSKIAVRQWCLALASTASLIAGAVALQSCGGEGGPVGNGGTGGGGETAITKAFKALQPAAQLNATFVGSDKCGECHTNRDIDGGATYEHWQETEHADRNVGCENCHGPGSVHVSGPSETNILTFPKVTSPIVCAQCHGKVYDEWRSSAHAELVASPVTGAPNNYKTSRCIQCHSGLFKTVVENGEDVNLMTVERVTELVGQTINVDDPESSAAPWSASCATCHNPHAKTGNLDVDGEEAQLRHPVTQTDVTAILPSTTPNTVDSWVNFNHVCGQCHNGRGADGTDTRLSMANATGRPNMHDSVQFNMLMGIKDSGAEAPTPPVVRNMAHATINGQCVKCHMPDARHTFTVSYDRSCQPCHTAADAAARATSIKSEVLSGLNALKARLDAWSTANLGGPGLWDYTALLPAGTTAPDQSLIPIEMRRARHNFYYVIRDLSFGLHNAPYTLYLLENANKNLDLVGAPTAMPAATAGRTVNSLLQEMRQIAARAAKAEIEITQ